MKKSIFTLAVLFAATFANAQITLEKTFETPTISDISLGSEVQILRDDYTSGNFPLAIGPYIVENLRWSSEELYQYTYNVYDIKTLALIKTLSYEASIGETSVITSMGLLSRGIFTNDNRWAWAYFKRTPTEYAATFELFIVTEDHTELLHVNVGSPSGTLFPPCIIKVEDQYKLIVRAYGSNRVITHLYSLPGNGETQDIETPVAPRSSARKILQKDQVLVENADKTYTLQGQEVK